MFRHLVSSAVGVVLLSAVAPAQVPVSVGSGVGGFGPRAGPSTMSPYGPVGPPVYRPGYVQPGRGVGGGHGGAVLVQGYPRYANPGRLGGAYPYYSYYGGYYPPYYYDPGP